jgi:hypothetical protein
MRLFAVAFGLATMIASAVHGSIIYDNFNDWNGEYTISWYGQAQRFPVPRGANTLVSWQSEFNVGMAGRTVGFSIRDVIDGVPGGATYFSSSLVVPAGGPVSVDLRIELLSGSTYAAVWDFRGYIWGSIYFTDVDVVPGEGMWRDALGWTVHQHLDQRMRAVFVPSTTSLGAFGACFLAALNRRRFSTPE